MLTPLAASPILYEGMGVVIYTHGFFFSLGAEVSLGVAALLAWRFGFSVRRALLLGASVFVGGISAARIGFFITYPSAFSSWGQVLSIWEGGLVSFWGLAAGALIARSMVKAEPEDTRARWWDIVALSAMAGWGIGRIGNYYAADSVGILSPEVWGAFYGRVPIQLFEAVLCLGIAVVGTRYALRGSKPGNVAWMASGAYFLGRVLIDTWRDEGGIGPFHYSQMVSLLIFTIIAIIWYLRRKQ